ncbi:MAG TPA: Flp family type IVb pilin [Gemmatimonadota bacterium]
MPRTLAAFLLDDEGQGLAEYALLLSLVTLVSVIAVRRLGPDVRRTFRAVRLAM